jgi:CO/xanthine dehydrogenase Mo-binding subunit
MSSYRVVGKPMRRIEGDEKVTGRKAYTADVRVPGTLWGKVLRSPLPHARIVRIDTSAARSLPGVHAVLTAADLPDRYIGRRLYDVTLLARGRVRHVGEKVAAVAAVDADVAEEAVGLIDVEYEALPAVFDPLAAMAPDAPLLHPDFASYRNAPDVGGHRNVHAYATWGMGDVEQGFAAAELTFEDTFTVPMQHQAYIEPHACQVQIADDGQVLVWSTGKQPFQTRDWLAEAIGLPPERVTVFPTAIGGDFGGKGFVFDEPLAYYLARASGRPVKMVMTYTEELTAGVPRHGAVVTIKTGLTRDGRIVARHARLYFNGGAFGGYKPNQNLGGARYAGGNYRTPHALIESYCVYTNQMPCGHMRAPGEAQAIFAVESHTDMLAARLGLDPLEFRRRNTLEAGDPSSIGEYWHHPRAREALERAAGEAGWGSPKAAPNVGRGIATCNHDIGYGKAGTVVAVDERGQVSVLTGVPDVGSGAHTTLRQFVAEELGIAPEDVTIDVGDTSRALWDSGSGAQRVTFIHGTATVNAARKLKTMLCEQAPDLMRWPASAVRLEGGEFVADGAARRVDFRDLAARAARANGGRLAARDVVEVHHETEDRTVTAQVVEVAVDEETGQVTLRKIVTVQDCGFILNPLIAAGHIEGAAITGLGYGVMEAVAVEDGTVQTANLGEYKIPSMRDAPALQSIFLDSEEGPSPFGSKAVGEISISPISAAIANAVDNAVGVRVTDLPVTAEKVYRLLKARARAADRA